MRFLPSIGKRRSRGRQPQALPRVLSRAEARALLAAAADNPRHQAVIAIGLYTGLRRSEIANLQVGDIDVGEGLMRVRSGKGGKDAMLPLNPRLLPYVSPFLDRHPDAPLIPGSGPKRGYSPRNIQIIVQRAAQRAGLPGHVHTHTLRHTYGTEVQRKGRDLSRTQRLMRHSSKSIRVTMLYVHLAVEDLRDTADELDFE